LRIRFCGILDPAAVQDAKIPTLKTNVLLQLVANIINAVCYQRYEKSLVLSNQKVVQMLMVALQKKLEEEL